MLIQIALLCVIFENAFAKFSSAFAVYQIIPRNDRELKILSELYENTDEFLDFWRPPSSINNSVDIMVYPEMRRNFTDWLHIAGFQYEIAIKDLAELILKREIPRRFGYLHNLFGEHRLKDDRSSSSTLPMGEYYSYDEIVQWMRNLERLHGNIVRLISIGTTHQGRSILGVV
uniref:Zinc carboxypeptidase A 1 n=2 Tax=Parascaris univalens TaxID=6257 RepID=A0A915AI59_PARUN